VWGGGSQDGNPSHPLSPKMQNLPQNRQNLVEPPVPHVAGVPEVTKMSPRKVTWQVGCRGRNRQFPANSLINGYNNKRFSQNIGREFLSTLLQCQSLPSSFPMSCVSEFSPYILVTEDFGGRKALSWIRKGQNFGWKLISGLRANFWWFWWIDNCSYMQQKN